MPESPSAPANWYSDPEDASQLRYWDGARWTEHRAPAVRPVAVDPSPAPASPSARPSTPGAMRRAAGAVRRWLGTLTAGGLLTLILLGAVTVLGFATTGAGGFIVAGLIAAATGLYSFFSRRPSWARINGRKLAAVVGGVGVAVLIIGSASYGAVRPSPPAEAIDAPPSQSVTEVPTPSASSTPTPTPSSLAEPDAPETPAVAQELASVVVADAAATQGVALTLLDSLPVKGRAPKTGYARTAMFGAAWLDMDRNGCDTRNDILARDISPTDLVRSGPCKVLSGTLDDVYSGSSIHFVRGNDTSMAVQIDHVVSLMNAWETGAQQLTQAQRITLANDPMNLYAVDGPTNAKKGAGDAATWLPPNKAFRCTYVAHQVSVKATYGLWVTQAEHDAIDRILETCPTEAAVTSPFTPQVAPAPEPAPVPAPAPEPAPAPAPAPAPEPAPVPAPVPVTGGSTFYANCDAVRAAGAAPIRVGDPGYSRKLDRDGDGVGCE